MQFIDIIFNVLLGENKAAVERVNIKLGLRILIGENKQIRKVYTLHRQFQLLGNQQVDHAQCNGISFAHFQHYVDHRITGGVEIFCVGAKLQFAKQHAVDHFDLVEGIEIRTELQPGLVIDLLQLLLEFVEFQVGVLIGGYDPHPRQQIVVIAVVPFIEPRLEGFILKGVDEVFNPLLHRWIKITLPLLFQERNDRGSNR